MVTRVGRTSIPITSSTAQHELPPHLAATPKIIKSWSRQDDWNELGEMAVN